MKKYFLVLLIIPVFFSLETPPLPLEAEGICHDFTLKLDVKDGYWSFLKNGCWDVKVDTPGKIMINNKWQDTFFYAPNVMCNGTSTLNVKFASSTNLAPVMKFRQGNEIYQSTINIVQNCPVPLSNRVFLFFVSAIILLILIGIWWYRK